GGCGLWAGTPALNFFFQAEDGIRDFHVTGVQTCALPIYGEHDQTREDPPAGSPGVAFVTSPHSDPLPVASPMVPCGTLAAGDARSEERRVGKECRSRCGPERCEKRACRQTRQRRGDDNTA